MIFGSGSLIGRILPLQSSTQTGLSRKMFQPVLSPLQVYSHTQWHVIGCLLTWDKTSGKKEVHDWQHRVGVICIFSLTIHITDKGKHIYMLFE